MSAISAPRLPIGEDITEWRLAQEALAEREEHPLVAKVCEVLD